MSDTKTEERIIEGLTLEQCVAKYEPMVHKFANSASMNSVCSNEDLCQEGRMAVVLAFQLYDESNKASLTTWVYHMVKDAILEYQKQNLSVLSGGAYLHNILRKVGQNATVEQIMEHGVSKKTALAAEYLKSSYVAEDYSELQSVIGDQEVDSKSVESFPWREQLSEEEAFAVGHFYGFFSPRMNMKDIATALGKSRKSISYMINKAIARLRHMPGIEDYWYN